MELTNMLLIQLSGKSSTHISNTYKSNTGFTDILNKAESSVTTKKDNYSNYNNYNNKKDNSYKTNNNVDSSKNVSSKKTEIQKNNSSNNTEKVSNYEKENKSYSINDDNSSSKEKVIIVDDETLNKLSQALGIPSDKIMEILANLSMSISMLQDNTNLISFLQVAFETENPVDLLSVDNIKDIMSNVVDIAKGINYQDTIAIDENLDETLTKLADSGIFEQNLTLINSNTQEVKQKIDELLNSLNGSVEQVTSGSIAESSNIKIYSNSESNQLSENIEMLENSEVVEEVMPTNLDNNAYYQENSQNTNQDSQGEMLLNKGIEDTNTNQEMFNVSGISNNTKVFNSSLPKTQVLRNINNTEVVAQIMEKIQVSVKPNVSEIKMLLKPEELGEVSLKIATQNGIVTAQFIAESQKVKEIIEANFNQLKDMLSEQGINVGALEVNVSSNGEEQGKYNNFEQSQSKNNGNIQNAIKDSFEEKQEQLKITEEQIIDSQVNYSI